jgi:hypothetical protein
MAFISGYGVDLAFVYTDQFPEIVAFAGESEVAHIVKVVDGDNAADGKYGPQMGAFVGHGLPPC